MRFASVTQRLIFWFVLVTLLPLLLIGYGMQAVFERELKQTLMRQISSIADKKTDQINYFLQERLRNALSKVQSGTVQQAMREFELEFKRGGVNSVAYHKLDANYREYMQHFVSAAGFYDLFLISPRGYVVYSQAHEVDFATNLFNGPYHLSGLSKVTRSAFETLQGNYSEYELYAPSDNAVAAFIAEPIMVKGKVIGVLALQMDNSAVYKSVLDKTGLGESGETVLARLENPQQALVLAPLDADANAALKHHIPLGDRLRAEPLRRALNGERGAGFYMDYSDVPVLAAWRYIPRLRAGMVVKIDAAEVLAPLYRVRYIGLLLIAIALGFAVLAAYLLGRRFVSPLQILNTSAQRFAEGKLDQRVAETGPDELGQLASAFNLMAAHLQDFYTDLEGQVVQRTAELGHSVENLRIKDAAIAYSINAIAIADINGKIFYANQAYMDLWRVAATGKIIGRALVELRDKPEDEQRVMTALKENGYWQGELQVFLDDGALAYLELSASMVMDSSDTPVCMVASFMDVSERKHAEEMLKQSNTELEQRVEQRTALLRVAKEEAEQASLSKSLFLTSMSHELRTPLNAILGYSQLMQLDPAMSQQDMVENAGEIRRAGDYLLNLVNDILDLARIESGRLELVPGAVKLAEVMNECRSYQVKFAEAHNVTLHLDDTCAAYEVVADHRGLVQVINNLISNGIKYNRAGGRVNVSCSEHEHGKVRISIMDTGTGIAADKQSQLFQAFNRLGAEMSHIEGTGIGLVISRKLVEGMHGAIGMESIHGVGSTFWVDLSLASCEYTAAGNTGSQKQAGTSTIKPKRVLVAEDYVPNQNVLLLQLQTMGCEVDIAENGVEAMSRWRNQHYDLILTDIDMPVMNGVEFAQMLRNEEHARGRERIPIIAVTATSMASEITRYKSAGIDEVLSKPLPMDALRAGLRRWLGNILGKPAPLDADNIGSETVVIENNTELDINYLYHILGQVNLEQAHILVNTFIRTAAEGLQALSLQMDNPVLVAKEMHKQKSSAKTVGALRYASMAATLEQKIKDKQFVDVAAELMLLRKALSDAQAEAARLLQSPRDQEAGLVATINPANVLCHSALVVDDDEVVLRQVKAMLGALGVAQVLTAANGLEAIRVLSARGEEIDVLLCDLNMPEMDGVELIRQFGKTGFKGGLILISGAEEKIISTVNKLAVLQGLRVLGQLQKPVSAAQLAILLAHTSNLPVQMHHEAIETVVTKEAISAAMAANQFTIWFQPKVEANSMRVVGMEALARWQLPSGQFISPYNFITVAEREGVITELSQLLVTIALDEAAKMFTAGYKLKVAINLSGTWLNDLNLPDFVFSKTKASGLRASDVILEVTETGVMEDLTTALDVLSRLRLKGFGLSIDDFGIGYSSFEQLGRIPFTEMKLDRSFVSKGGEDAAARAILESSMDMAHKLSLSTVAEGVETELELKLVRSLGCDLLQGFLIAKPMPVNVLIDWLEKRNSKAKK